MVWHFEGSKLHKMLSSFTGLPCSIKKDALLIPVISVGPMISHFTFKYACIITLRVFQKLACYIFEAKPRISVL